MKTPTTTDNFKPVIKWTGSKRHQANDIISCIKNKDYSQSTYYEPFVGGGSVLFRLLHSDITFKKYVCSDTCKPLIELWIMIKENPDKLMDYYTWAWNELQVKGHKAYYDIRDDFNKKFLPEQLFFLCRTCINGLIRFNSKGEFNSAVNYHRGGMKPHTLRKIVDYWSFKLNEFNVEFRCCDYTDIIPDKDDLLYSDSPYFKTQGMYYGAINKDDFIDYIEGLKCDYLISLDGKSGEADYTDFLPEELYDKHIFIHSGLSSFKRIFNKEQVIVHDSLYLKFM